MVTNTTNGTIAFIILTSGGYEMGTSIFRSWTGKLFAIALSVAVLYGTANAGLISSVTTFGTESGTGTGLGTVSVPVILTVNTNNDNQVGGGALDNNITVPIKRFDSNGYIDIVFNVASTNGVTEYKVFESVDNNTGVDWSKYTMVLGYGWGASFVQSTAGDGLDFDAPDYDSSPVSSSFANVLTNDEDVLVFYSGTHGSGSETYQLRIDVPDIIEASGLPASFTLRQIPIPVPEPSVCLLILGALTGAWIYRKHRA
jgi:hypothetical protein